VGSWGRAFIPGEIRTAGFALPLLTRGAGQAGEVWLFGKNFSHGSVVRELSKEKKNKWFFLIDGTGLFDQQRSPRLKRLSAKLDDVEATDERR
jgi:hypothetical protein